MRKVASVLVSHHRDLALLTAVREVVVARADVVVRACSEAHHGALVRGRCVVELVVHIVLLSVRLPVLARARCEAPAME